MRNCVRINRHEGNKSEIIVKQILDKQRKEIEKVIPGLKNGKIVPQLTKKYNKAQKDKVDAENELKIFLHKYNLTGYFTSDGRDEDSVQNYKAHIQSDEDCADIPPEVARELQLAHNLLELGRKKEAQDIWSKYVKKYKLDQV